MWDRRSVIRERLWRAAGTLLLGAALAGSAAPVGAADTAPHIPITEEVLPNGLKVLLVEAPKAPVVSVQVWYRVGTRNEVPGLTGLSHMLEHMMFKGTPTVPIKVFDRLIQKAGGTDNAFTYHDATAYYENLSADHLELALRLEADRMRNVLFDEKEFQSERDVVVEERRLRQEDDPIAALYEVVHPAAFSAHPYANPVIGWMHDIRGMRLDDLKHHYNTYYAPNNAVLVVSGAVRPAEALPLIRRYFGGIPRGPDPPPVRAVRPPQQGERRVYLRKEAELPYVVLAYPVPNARDADSLALDLLETILAGGRSSRLHRSLVYEKQLALSAGASNSRLSIDPNLFTIYASLLPGKTAEEVEKALEAEIERVKRDPVSDQELEKAKNQNEADFVMGMDSVYNLGRGVMTVELSTTWKDFDRYIPDIRAVTAADVQRVAQKYLVSDHRTVGTLVPIKPNP
jgi:zinc protease